MKQTKHILLTLVMLLFSLAASAHDFAVGGIFYNITSSANKTVEVTFKGSSYDEYTGEYSGTITIPATVTYEGRMYSVTSIGDYAFQYCISLTSITIPESVTSIGEWAFFGCSSLTTINIPEGVTSIGTYAFSGCAGELTVNCNIPSYAFSGSAFTKVTIGDKVTSIGWSAFQGCSSLTTINIPEGVTSIGDRAFYNCSSLTTVILPESVTYIDECAFKYCTSLTSIVLPKNLNKVDYNAFASCTNLRDVYCFAEVVPSTMSDAFLGSSFENATLHVPASTLEAYRSTAPWSSFGTIVALTEEEMGVKNSEITNQESELIYDLRGHRVDNPTRDDIYIVGGKKMVW